MPRSVLDAIAAEATSFSLFDGKAPFLQDPSARGGRDMSAGSLSAEFACGTNIAHFHHGDDKRMRLCLRCATIGMLRLVPWSQSGGAGKSPSIHNAPPIMALAAGPNLAITLGLNLVPLPGDAGAAKWTGHFKPRKRDAAIPYLEALTWNPRRVHLRSPETADVCWRCGQTQVVAVGPIDYAKNEWTTARKGNGNKTIPFVWEDPSAFYRPDATYTTVKSGEDKRGKEPQAVNGGDLHFLLKREDAPRSAVSEANPGHQGWHLIIPCTNPANNKTFDHRQLDLTVLSPDAVRAILPADLPEEPVGLDGWSAPRRASSDGGAARFVRAAAHLLTDADWGVLSAAAYKKMHECPAAFDLFTGLFWSLRRKKVQGLPSRKAAWLVLKLMAVVPSRARMFRANAGFCPLEALPKRQLRERRTDGPRASPYPASFPRGHRLEAEIGRLLDGNVRLRKPEPIDWAGLCYGLNQLID
jgi:hypothetical protein